MPASRSRSRRRNKKDERAEKAEKKSEKEKEERRGCSADCLVEKGTRKSTRQKNKITHSGREARAPGAVGISRPRSSVYAATVTAGRQPCSRQWRNAATLMGAGGSGEIEELCCSRRRTSISMSPMPISTLAVQGRGGLHGVHTQELLSGQRPCLHPNQNGSYYIVDNNTQNPPTWTSSGWSLQSNAVPCGRYHPYGRYRVQRGGRGLIWHCSWYISRIKGPRALQSGQFLRAFPTLAERRLQCWRCAMA